jgi:hypothetical protein
VAGLAWLAGCGGGTAPGPDVQVRVTPQTATLAASATQQFTATVTGSSNTAVTWSVKSGGVGGTISSGGLYTAPAVAGTDTVIATSQAAPTASGSAAVTVTLSGSDPLTATLLPAAAVAAGAMWNVDGGSWLQSGTTVGVAPGSHTIGFLAVTGWTAPAGVTITVAGSTTLPAADVTYTQQTGGATVPVSRSAR